MSEAWVVGLVTLAGTAVIVGIQTIVSVLTARWQVRVSRASPVPTVATPPASPQRQPSHASPAAVPTPVKVEFEDAVPRWVIKAILFVVQWTAVYFLVMEYRSDAPLTRHSAVFIASMGGVLLLCVVIHLVTAIYDYIASTVELITRR